MDRTKRNFILELTGFLCSLALVATSASAMIGKVSRPELIALTAGSFGTGVTLVRIIRTRASARNPRKDALRPDVPE
jgi:hypothetical protein